jgi:hypothetical protein
MREIKPVDLLAAATALARLHSLFASISGRIGDEVLIPESVNSISSGLARFRKEAEAVGATFAVKATDKHLRTVLAVPRTMTVGEAVSAMQDIESRFADHVEDIQMFMLAPGEEVFMQPADALMDIPDFATRFPNASFEVEEASKCLVMARHTASVFHAMRLLEIGIRALAKRLNIDDPTKPAERNWKFILGKIQARIDELWPPSSRAPHSEGAKFEALHATLDAVRNPWRNATMHVETIYAPHEALHILRCSAYFMRELSNLSDEDGGVPEAENPLELEQATVADQQEE